MRYRALGVLGAGVLAAGLVGAQEISGLRLGFMGGAYEFRHRVGELEDAYRIAESGDIELLPNPTVYGRVEARLRVEVSPAANGTGTIRVSSGEWAATVHVAADGSLVGDELATGLPFGYGFLPKAGHAAVGAAWEQTFPPPHRSRGPQVQVTYRYTLVGKREQKGCGDCVEVRIAGLRRFLPGAAFERAAAGLHLMPSEAYLVQDQLFAIGKVLFSPGEGFLFRYEMHANPSALTPMTVPGMLRTLVMERAEVMP